MLAIGVAFVSIPQAAVERYYSNLAYPVWQRGATSATNLIPFALSDLLLVGAAVFLIIGMGRIVVRGRSRGWMRETTAFVARLASMAATIYLAFLITWGLNYRRLPITEKLRFEPSAVSSDAALQLALSAVQSLNTLYERAHASLPGTFVIDPSLARAFDGAQQAVGVSRPAHPGRPKWTILDLYFEAAGVEGMTDPFFLETLVAGDLLPFERPFVIAHEWSHLAGFADEGEANFVGWLTCTRGSDAAQYSGWLFLYGQLFFALKDTDRAVIAERLDPGPGADLRAVAERVRRQVKPLIANAGWHVYDRYLKANRVEAGAASYAEVVRLVLGVRLGPA